MIWYNVHSMIDARIAPFGLLLLYSVGVVVVAISNGLSFTLLMVLLLLLPLIVLLQREHLALQPMALMSLFGATMLLLLESFATSTGSWYSVSNSLWRGWGGLSLEGILFAFLSTLYLVVLYEYFFDDRVLKGVRYRHGVWRLWVVALLLLLATYVSLFTFLVVTHALAWIVGSLFVTLVLMMLIASPKDPCKLLQKILWYTLFMSPFMFLLELVATVYTVRVYAFTSEYLAVLPWYNATVPLEELILVLLLPGALVLCYELFIDDAC